MHDIAGAHIGAPRRNWIVLTAAALAVAVGLVAVGRFTAPTTKTAAAPAPCGTFAPAVTPSRACFQVLERACGTGTARSGDFVAAFAPATLPPRAAQLPVDLRHQSAGPKRRLCAVRAMCLACIVAAVVC